jgi:urease gamma subunit
VICIKAIVKGEADIPPFTKVFTYGDSFDEELIFRNSVDMVKKKLEQKLKINVNESLLVYVAYIVEQLRTGKSFDYLESNASKLLTMHQVMIGVPETLSKISFEVALHFHLRPMYIILDQPIKTARIFLSIQ